MIDSTAGETIAAPRPCTARAAISTPIVFGEPADERRCREDRDADHEHAPAAEQVGRAPAEQEEAAERDRVRDQHPLQRAVADVQRRLDRRQRDGDDRAVEDRHEERHAHQRQRLPAAWVGLVIGRFEHVGIVPPQPADRIPETRSP